MTGLILIPVLYYTYTGIFGKSVDWFNIAVFFITTAVSYFVEAWILNHKKSIFVSEKNSKTLLQDNMVSESKCFYLQKGGYNCKMSLVSSKKIKHGERHYETRFKYQGN